ncbi:hypothetical protein Tco_1313528 [Tanacetum coccineum]
MLRGKVCSLVEPGGDYLILEARRVRRRMNWREFILALGLHTAEEMQTAGFDLYWSESARHIPDKGDLSAYWIEILSVAGGMDVGSVNVPYLLARYLRLFASGRNHGAMISGALGSERQPGVVAGAPKAAKDAPVVDEGALAVPAPVQAPQPPPRAAGPTQTMAQRLAGVEEDVNEIRGALGEHRVILDSMACDFSRISTWTVVGLSQMMSQAGVRYTSYVDFQIPYVRCTRCKIDGANTSIA